MCESTLNCVSKTNNLFTDMTITNFYGVSSADNSATESDGGDITSVLKSRRFAAARAAEERTKKERELLMRFVGRLIYFTMRFVGRLIYFTTGKGKLNYFRLNLFAFIEGGLKKPKSKNFNEKGSSLKDGTL